MMLPVFQVGPQTANTPPQYLILQSPPAVAKISHYRPLCQPCLHLSLYSPTQRSLSSPPATAAMYRPPLVRRRQPLNHACHTHQTRNDISWRRRSRPKPLTSPLPRSSIPRCLPSPVPYLSGNYRHPPFEGPRLPTSLRPPDLNSPPLHLPPHSLYAAPPPHA